ncbi:hypothetical protein D3C74_49530 [compost metagenome]
MAKKPSTKSKLPELLKWKKRPFLDKMLDDGVSPNACAKWCNENGFVVSVPTIYAYAKKRKESIIKDVQAEELMRDKRKGENYKEKDDPSNIEKYNPTNEDRRKANATVDRVKSDMELLDMVIQKGMNALNVMEYIKPEIAIKAIEMKNKITGGSHQGFTTYGLEEIRLREAARENAVMVILLEFVPEEQHDAVIARMEQATRDYYAGIGLGEAYEETLKEGGAR